MPLTTTTMNDYTALRVKYITTPCTAVYTRLRKVLSTTCMRTIPKLVWCCSMMYALRSMLIHVLLLLHVILITENNRKGTHTPRVTKHLQKKSRV